MDAKTHWTWQTGKINNGSLQGSRTCAIYNGAVRVALAAARKLPSNMATKLNKKVGQLKQVRPRLYRRCLCQVPTDLTARAFCRSLVCRPQWTAERSGKATKSEVDDDFKALDAVTAPAAVLLRGHRLANARCTQSLRWRSSRPRRRSWRPSKSWRTTPEVSCTWHSRCRRRLAVSSVRPRRPCHNPRQPRPNRDVFATVK